MIANSASTKVKSNTPSRRLVVGLVIPLIIAFLIGIAADKISTLQADPNDVSDFEIGFFIIVPVTAALLMVLLRVFRVRKVPVIILLTTVSFVAAMIFGFWFLSVRGQVVDGTYILVYIFGFLPALAVGILYGIYLSLVTRRVFKE